MATDRRIGAKVDFIVYAGETWQDRWNIQNINGDNIDLDGFEVGPLVIYKKDKNSTVVATLTGLTIEGSEIVLSNIINPTIRKTLVTGYYFECPIIPPGGSPNAIVHGLIQVDAKR